MGLYLGQSLLQVIVHKQASGEQLSSLKAKASFTQRKLVKILTLGRQGFVSIDLVHTIVWPMIDNDCHRSCVVTKEPDIR